MPSGGERKQRVDTKPMPVSGPGRLSQRTDMIPSGGAYGDRKEITDILAQGNRATPQPNRQQPALAGLFDPTNSPTEAVTAGNPLGEGPGPEILNLPNRTFNPAQIMTRLAAADPSGSIEMVLKEMQDKGIV